MKTDAINFALNKQILANNSCNSSVNNNHSKLSNNSNNINDNNQSLNNTFIQSGDSNIDITLKVKHETFIRSFAIPTHLYRYLAQRHRECPLYLDRTLSYLRPDVINRLKTNGNFVFIII